MKKIYCILLGLILSIPLWSQSYPAAVSRRNAEFRKTRSDDGRPGRNYWQNHASYDIEIELQPDSNMLHGTEKVLYFNESPDTLKQLVVRLYQNFFRTETPRQYEINSRDLHQGVLIDALIVDRKAYDLSNTRQIRRTSTNLIIYLQEPVIPGGRAELSVRWTMRIPSFSRIRMGHYSSGGLFMAYFYPQIAVYDDIDGWDLNEYLGLTEFYNDFSSYSFSLKVPGDYVVWATGECTNYSEIYNDHIINKISFANSSDTTVSILTSTNQPLSVFKDIALLRTWKFKATHVPDISFALAKNYCWDASSLTVDSSAGRRVLVSAVYPDGTRHYDKVAEIARHSVAYLSYNLPGVPYPYSHSTTFCNGQTDGGMEFPMMTNNGAPATLAGITGLTFHEIAHTYFPFFMGINERKYAWMDEGWATFSPVDVVDRYDNTYDYDAHVVTNYLSQACTEYNVPLMVNSSMLNSPSYRGASYYRSAMAYKFLQDALGPELFLKSLQEFIHQWNGKHPLPADFFNIFGAIAGKDLHWFWDPWFYEIKCPDLRIGAIKKSGKHISIGIENTGGLPLPVHLRIENLEGSVQEFYATCAIWEDGNTYKTIKIRREGLPVKIYLGDVHTPDIQPADNVKIIP